MSFTKLSDRVRHNGQITTLAEMLDNRNACVRKVNNFHAPRAKTGIVKAYFCDVIENGEFTKSGWRIGQKAYESRKAKGQDFETLRDKMTQEEESNQWVTIKEATKYLLKLEDNNPEFLYDTLLPALESFARAGKTPITPPIMGAFTAIGALQQDQADKLIGYLTN